MWSFSFIVKSLFGWSLLDGFGKKIRFLFEFLAYTLWFQYWLHKNQPDNYILVKVCQNAFANGAILVTQVWFFVMDSQSASFSLYLPLYILWMWWMKDNNKDCIFKFIVLFFGACLVSRWQIDTSFCFIYCIYFVSEFSNSWCLESNINYHFYKFPMCDVWITFQLCVLICVMLRMHNIHVYLIYHYSLKLDNSSASLFGI